MQHIILIIMALALWVPAQADPRAADQARALIADFQSDMDRAGEWNHYTIVATVDPQRRTIEGRLTLTYVNRDSAPLDRLYFRLFPNLADLGGRLEISAASVGGQSRPVTYERQRYLLRLNLARALAPGEQAEVVLAFRTVAPANAGRRFYGAFNLQNNVLSLASSYPLVAMVRDSRWDIVPPDTRGDLVNSETALYDVTLTAPVDWTLITTGVAIDGRLDAGRQTARFVSGPQRDFMIVAAKLKVASAEVSGTRVNAFYQPGDDAGGQASLRTATRALEAFNKRFGRYPLAELDIVPVDAGSFLGVEYPGIVLIERRLYRNSPGELEITVAHEVAHQWWYSLVGNNVQQEAWLDEALATYAQVVYAEEALGAEAAAAQVARLRASYRQVRAAGRDAAIQQPNLRIRNYFALVYAKGGLFFVALRQQIGDEAFGRFLQTYYANHRYGVVTGADLLGTAEESCACELDAFYRDWILTAAPVAIP